VRLPRGRFGGWHAQAGAVFLIVSLVAALFGFAGIASAAAGIAKVPFFIFIALFVILLVVGLMLGSALF
jgi:uncharacterized membrane protein YtjA (UPF0391 family)